MFNILVIAAVLLVLILVFLVWRLASVGRGMRQRDAKLMERLAPLARMLQSGQKVSGNEIDTLAKRPENRFPLFALLRAMKRLDLLPTLYSSSSDQGASALAYWMMHPNELQDAPDAIELVETISRPVAGRDAEFHVYRYRMPSGHWAAKDGWILGLAGPMIPGIEPYAQRPGAFSRASDIEGNVTPSALVEWWIDMLRQKGMVK